MVQTIELDCGNSLTSPDDIIDIVILGTGLPKRKPDHKFYTKWMWDYSDIDPDVWEDAKPILEARIKQLHENGTIVYGSW